MMVKKNYKLLSFFHKKVSRSESGNAISEFMIAWPFLGVIALSIFDLSMALSQYVQLTEAAHQGVRLAAGYEQLSVGTARGMAGATGTNCAAASGNQFHQRVQDRVNQLITVQNLWLDTTKLCIESGRVAGGAATNPDTVHVRVSSNYNAVIPVFRNLPITVEVRAPHL